jgi:signal transduction histidine kinase
MNATMRIAPPQSGRTSGSAAKRLLMNRAQVARAADRRPLDPREVVRRVISLVETQALKEGVTTVFRPPAGGEELVPGDADQLTQLLLNIAFNGVQAMAPHGGVEFALSLPAA